MRCTIQFKLGNDIIIINDLESTDDLQGISKLSEIEDLLVSNQFNESLLSAIDKISDYKSKLVREITGSYLEEEGTITSSVSATGNFSTQSLISDTALPNKTVGQVLSAIHSSVYVNTNAGKFINQVLSDESILDEDRIISFVTNKITDVKGNEVKGFFDRQSNRIFVKVEDEANLTQPEIECIAHELVHFLAKRRAVNGAFYWATPGKLEEFLNSKPKSKVVQAKLDLIKQSPKEDQIEELLAEAYSNKEFHDYMVEKGHLHFQDDVLVTGLEKFDYNPKDIVDTENPDKDVVFKRKEELDLVPVTEVLKGIDKESHAAVANTIRTDFEKHKASKDFDLNYGEAISISDNNKRTQILSLKQRDLVLVPFFKWNSKTQSHEILTGSEAGASYRPIISRYFDKAGQLMIKVPASDKSNAQSFDLPAFKFVQRYRPYMGEIISTLSQKEIDSAVKLLEAAYDPKLDNFFKERSVVIKKGSRAGEEIKVFKPTNLDSVAFSFSNYIPEGEFFDQSPIRPLFEEILPEDIIKVKFTDSDHEFPAVVTKKFGNSVEAVTSKGKVLIIHPKNLVGIVFKESNHPSFVELKGMATDSTLSRIAYEQASKGEYRISKNWLKTNKLTYFEIKKGIKSYYSLEGNRDSKEYQQGLANRRYAISKLKLGDLVKVEWNVDGNVSSGWYHVIGTTKNTVYFYTKNGIVQHLNIEQVDPNKTRILAIGYNNVKEAKLVDDFQALYTKANRLFDDPKGASAAFTEALKTGQKTNINQRYFIKEVKAQNDDELDIPGNSTEQEVAEAYAQVERGDIVKVKRTNLNDEEYTQWRVVVGRDEIGRAITAGFSKAYTQHFDSGKTYDHAEGYKVYPINENDVVAVGLRVDPDESLGIDGHSEIRTQSEFFMEKLDKFNKVKLISNLSEVSSNLLKMYEPVEATLVVRNGKEAWVKKVRSTDVKKATTEKKWFLKDRHKKQGFLLTEGKFNYEYIWYPQEIERGVIHSKLKPGDIITERYTKKSDGQYGYIDSIVLNVFGSGITTYKYLYDEKEKKFVAQQNTIFKKKEGSDFPSFYSVAFAKSGRGMVNGVSGAKKVREEVLKHTTKNNRTASMETDNFVKSKDSREKIIMVAEKLQSIYGVKIKVLTSVELEDTMSDVVADAASLRAFIHNGIIYINSDRASAAEPLHEMGHLVLGVVQQTDPDLFEAMMYKIRNHKDYDVIAQNYSDLSGDALDTEVFVTLFAEQYRSKNKGFFSKIVNFVKRIFSKVFNSPSLMDMSDDAFMEMSLDKLFIKFGDDLLGKKFDYQVDQFLKAVNSKVEELKSSLFNENKLTMQCY